MRGTRSGPPRCVRPGDPFRDGSEFGARTGLDLRYGRGAQFTLDATTFVAEPSAESSDLRGRTDLRGRRAAVAVRCRGFPPIDPTDREGVAMPNRSLIRLTLLALSAVLFQPLHLQAQSFTLEQVRDYPFPTDLVASPTGARIAWVFNEAGVRNVYVAEAPDWSARRLTSYPEDDGQEITQLAFSPDGGRVIYVRGGDHGSNWEAPPPVPTSSPIQPSVGIWSVAVSGGPPRLLAEGDAPAMSWKGDVAFEKSGAIWVVPSDGSRPAARLFAERGGSSDPVWSPDGSKLAFVSQRGDHAFIGVFADSAHPIRWLAPSTNRDGMPRWSPDGRRIAFVRRPGAGGAPDDWMHPPPSRWSIFAADVDSGDGREVWRSPTDSDRGSYPTTEGQANLQWATGDRIVFLADLDGWPHLYSVPVAGGAPLLLTPHAGMAEYITLSRDRRFLLFAGNMGDGEQDIERRHVFRVPVDRPALENLTPGAGNEWTPVATGDLQWISWLGGDARRPSIPHVAPAGGGRAVAIGEDRIPAAFPVDGLVTPRAVTFRAEDGVEVHADLFEPPADAPRDVVQNGRRPAAIFIHGGPPRQMLLGWHYSYYYANAYAVNQYLASRGFVVLSVNYRLGIGYGHEFHHPDSAGARGASEYRDIVAAGRYLAGLSQVDPKRIGLWGGSYGGFLTAMGLARNSELFAAGSDLHGVHDFTADGGGRYGRGEWRYEMPDRELARRAEIAWRSSPIAYVETWRSPVLLIQGDDDRNVRFHQTVDLARRLEAHGVDVEEIVIPDEIHDFLRHESWLLADKATADYLVRKLGGAAATATHRRN